MPDPDLLTTLTQFGFAGLIAWMWLTERRAGAAREQQLTQAHERLLEQRVQLDALLSALSENTRAITSLESSQRALADAVHKLWQHAAEPHACDAKPCR